MKRLTRIRLINWHRFAHHSLPVEGNLLLVGDNGTGKSTVLDAVQVGLVGGMRSVRLNVAANEAGDRDLRGYVRGLISAGDGNGRPPRYLRGDATAYILLEWTDDAGEVVTFGTVIDATTDGRTPHKEHFLADGVPADDVPCLDEGHAPRTLREFTRLVRRRSEYRLYPRVEDYQRAVRRALGGLSAAFFRRFVSGIAFRRVRNVRDFVQGFLLDDEAGVSVESLTTAVARYHDLHALAVEARQRIELLRRIVQATEEARAHERRAAVLDCLLERVTVALAEGALDEAVGRAGQSRGSLRSAEAHHRQCEQEHATARGAWERLLSQQSRRDARPSDDARREQDQLRELLARDEQDLRRLTTSLQPVRQALASWQHVAKQLTVAGIEPPAIDTKSMKSLSAALDRIGKASKNAADLTPLAEQLAEQWPRLTDAVRHLDDELRQRSRAAEECNTDEPRDAVAKAAGALRERLSRELGIEAHVLADVVTPTRAVSAEAIAAALGPRWFDVLVPAEQFEAALAIYQEMPALPGAIGLIDTPSLRRTRMIQPAAGSLAAAVATDNADARRYLDAALGGVFTESAAGQRRTITAGGVVRDGYTVRRVPAQSVPFRESVKPKRHAASGKTQSAPSAELREAVRQLQEHIYAGRLGVQMLSELAGLPAEITRRRKRLAELDAETKAAKSVTESPKRDDAEAALKEARQAEQQSAEALRGAWGWLCVAKREAEAADKERERRRERVVRATEAYESRWPAGHATRDAAEAEFSGIAPEPAALKRSLEAEREQVAREARPAAERALRWQVEYGNRYGSAGSTEAIDFAAELARWERSELPAHEERIAQARESARRALEEEVVHRLREGVTRMERSFRELNRALDGLVFSGRRYRFIHKLRKGREPLYRMVRAADRGDTVPLDRTEWRTDFLEPLGELLEDLLRHPSAKAVATLEDRADFRQWFDFDIEITDADGQMHLFSRTAGSGSGGETQAPFYVAVLASLARMYRPRRGEPAAGLVAFDEPFQKMDESNVAGTLRLAKRLGLQLMLAAPKERCEQILPHAGTATCLLMLRDADDVLVEPFQRYEPGPTEPAEPGETLTLRRSRVRGAK